MGMRKLMLLLLGAILIGILTFFCFSGKAGGIQDDLISKAQTALTGNGLGEKVAVGIVGSGYGLKRILTLDGTVESEAAKAEAGKLAAAQEGVSGVQNNLIVKKPAPKVVIPSPYIMDVIRGRDSKVILKGFVPSAKIHTSVTSKAKSMFGEENVQDLLQEVKGAPEGWMETALLGMDKLGVVDYGEYHISDNNFGFKGFVDNMDKKTPLEQSLSTSLNKSYKGAYVIDAPEPAPEPEPIPEPVPEPVPEPEPVAAAVSCQEEFTKVLITHKVHFEYNKAVISADSYGLLDNLMEIAGKCPDASIEIGGHTDSDGSEAYNKRLSQSRASAVKSYLTNKGMSENRLTAVGYGELDPVANNGTKEGKAKNRRIEFKVKGVK